MANILTRIDDFIPSDLIGDTPTEREYFKRNYVLFRAKGLSDEQAIEQATNAIKRQRQLIRREKAGK